MRAVCVGVFVAMLCGCGGEDGAKGGGGGASGAGSGTGGNVASASVDCSNADTGEALTCSGTACCAPANATHYCADSCAEPITYACDGPEDCGGHPCCWGAGATSGTTCASGSTCSGAAPLCETSAECPPASPCCLRVIFNDITVQMCTDSSGSLCL